jgi:hypothetical protein
MFVTVIDNRVVVSLSRRNLRQLDDMFKRHDVRNRCLVRKDGRGVALVVRVEEDADHYEGRDPARA